MKRLFRDVVVIVVAMCASVAAPSEMAGADDGAVARFSEIVLHAMCADGGAWMETYKLPRSSCTDVSRSVMEPCMKRVLEGHTVPLASEAELQQVSQALYACMKDSFIAKYGK